MEKGIKIYGNTNRRDHCERIFEFHTIVTFYVYYVTLRAASRSSGAVSRNVYPTGRSCELETDQSGIRSLSVTDGSRAHPTGYTDRAYSRSHRAYRLSTRVRRDHEHARVSLRPISFTPAPWNFDSRWQWLRKER